MALSAENTEAQVNLAFAEMFFAQACTAYKAGDLPTFEAARTLVLLNLGLSVDTLKRSR